MYFLNACFQWYKTGTKLHVSRYCIQYWKVANWNFTGGLVWRRGPNLLLAYLKFLVKICNRKINVGLGKLPKVGFDGYLGKYCQQSSYTVLKMSHVCLSKKQVPLIFQMLLIIYFCICISCFRCQRMFVAQLNLEENIARNQALCENVFMMVICIELRIPLFVVGRPGSSKSLAKTIVQDNMQGNLSKSNLFKNFKQVSYDYDLY